MVDDLEVNVFWRSLFGVAGFNQSIERHLSTGAAGTALPCGAALPGRARWSLTNAA